MLWVPCARFDVPDGAGFQAVSEAARSLDILLGALEANDVARMNVSLSGDALDRLERSFPAIVAAAARLVDRESIELMTTPDHGALLPLLPVHEIERQLRLNHLALRRRFGDAFKPRTIWPTALATSPRVIRTAGRMGAEVVLVDGSALPDPLALAGLRIDWAIEMPGLFLLPVGRMDSDLLASGLEIPFDELRWRPADHDLTFRVVALDWRPAMAEPSGLARLLRGARTARIGDMLELFPKDHAARLPAGSAAAVAGSVQPLAGWCANGQAVERTERATRLAERIRELGEAGLAALPEVRSARAELDRAWRADRWIDGATDDLARIERELDKVRTLGPIHGAPPVL